MSIKTEIEWFRCDEKMPQEYDKIIFIINEDIKTGKIILYSEEDEDTGEFYHSTEFISEGVGYTYVKYWAYLPKLPEFELIF